MWMIVVTKQLPKWTKMLGIRPEPSDAKCAIPHYRLVNANQNNFTGMSIVKIPFEWDG